MPDQANSSRANGASVSLIFGALAFLMIILPMAATELVMLSMSLLFLVFPLIAVVVGVTAIVFFARARRSWRSLPKEERRQVKGRGVARIGLTGGIAGVLVGGFYAIGFLVIVESMKGAPNHPAGIAEIHYLGMPDFDDRARESTLLPDSTILSTGWRMARDKLTDLAHRDGSILIRSNLQGEQIWYKHFPDAGNLRAIPTGKGSILCAMTVPAQEDAGATTRLLLKLTTMTFTGESINSMVYDFGVSSYITALTPYVNGSVLIYGAIRDGMTDGERSYLMTVNDNADSLWMRTYPKLPETVLTDALVTSEGTIICTGYTDDEMDGRFHLRGFTTNLQGEPMRRETSWDSIDVGVVRIYEPENGGMVMIGNRYFRGRALEGRVLRFDPGGELLWNKPVGDGNYTYVTDVAPWGDDGWITVGWLSKTKSLLTAKSIQAWTTYYINWLDAEGNVSEGFHGEHERFQAWDVLPIRNDYCVITGWGGRGEMQKRGEPVDEDVGLLHYWAGRD